MPWQSVSSLFVVGGMFNVVAGLVGGIHYLSEGVSTHRRSTDWIEVWFEELDGLLLAFSLTLLVLGKVDVCFISWAYLFTKEVLLERTVVLILYSFAPYSHISFNLLPSNRNPRSWECARTNSSIAWRREI